MQKKSSKKKEKSQKSLTKWLWISVGLLLLDQIIKNIFFYRYPFVDAKIVVFQRVLNTGASFGSFQGINSLLIWVSIIVFGLFLFYFDKIPKQYLNASIIAAGGVLSNLIDRVFKLAVVDFINLGWWPVFNIADMMIVCGILYIVLIMLKEEREEFQKAKKKKNSKKKSSAKKTVRKRGRT